MFEGSCGTDCRFESAFRERPLAEQIGCIGTHCGFRARRFTPKRRFLRGFLQNTSVPVEPIVGSAAPIQYNCTKAEGFESVPVEPTMGSRCFYAVYGATFCCSSHEREDTQFVKRKLIAGTKEVYILLHGIGRSSIWYGYGAAV